jgi:ABC-type branched-subunit amino acid transport system permease subunit
MAEAVTAPALAPSFTGELDMRRILTQGLLAGLTGVFVAIIGMVESFSERSVVDPVIDLGYLALVWLPTVFGYQATYRATLEGMETPRTGVHNVIGGAITGLVSGLVMGLLLLLIDNAELRDIFPNVTPGLFELLTFDNGLGFGILAMLAAGTALGALGGALHLMSSRLRNAFVAAFIWIVIIGLLEVIIGQITNEIGLGFLDDAIYSGERGLTWGAALFVGIAAFAIAYAVGGRQSVRSRVATLPPEQRRLIGLSAAVVLVALGFLLPTILGSFLNEILSTVGLFLLLGLGLNIVVGFAGLLDLGYVAFFAVGAYTTAVLTSPSSPSFSPELTFWVAIPFVILAAAIAGIFVGTPVIRMRGDYLAIVTLGFGEIARVLFLSDASAPVFGGAQGILSIPSITIWRGWAKWGLLLLAVGLEIGVYLWAKRRPKADLDEHGRRARFWGIVGLQIGVLAALWLYWEVAQDEGPIVILGTNTQAIFYFILVFVILAAYVSWRLQDSRTGRAWMAMREDEQVAEVMGINIVTTKLLAFVIGAILASFGGALFAVKIGSIFPNSFALIVSILVLVLIIVGGMGNIPGVAIGALVLIGILGGPTQAGLLREFEGFKLLIYGSLLIFMMLKRPEGLLPSSRRAQELHQEEFLQDEWLKQQASGDTEEAEEKV